MKSAILNCVTAVQLCSVAAIWTGLKSRQDLRQVHLASNWVKGKLDLHKFTEMTTRQNMCSSSNIRHLNDMKNLRSSTDYLQLHVQFARKKIPYNSINQAACYRYEIGSERQKKLATCQHSVTLDDKYHERVATVLMARGRIILLCMPTGGMAGHAKYALPW